MGTNYYTKTNKCESCGHKPYGIHIGKSSFGWQFSFQYNGGRYYKNFEQLKEWLKDKEIEDEYGETISFKDFIDMIEKKQSKFTHNHAKENPSDTDYVLDGYSFTDCEFS